jgi:hypothetical protein
MGVANLSKHFLVAWGWFMPRNRLFLAAMLTCGGAIYGQTTPSPLPSPSAKTVPNTLPPSVAGETRGLPPATSSATSATEKLSESLTSIHPQAIDLQWQDYRWQLVDGEKPVKDFGRREMEAKTALYLIRELGLTQHGSIGSPQPVMEYWLADGHAPVGPVRGLRTRPIDLATLRVEEAQKQWMVRDTYQVLFNFGTHEDDARQAAAVLRKYRFSQIGAIGQGTPVMLVFLSSPEKIGATEPTLRTTRMTSNVHVDAPTTDANEVIGPDGFPVLQRKSPLHPRESMSKDENTLHAPVASTAPQGRQLSPPNQLLPDMEALVECVPFDWRQIKMVKQEQDWQLKAGSYTFARFGNDEQAAKQALGMLQFYRCTEQCLVGGGKQPVLTYYLANGQAPHGLMLGGSNGVAFHANDLKVHQESAGWSITDGHQILLGFDKEDSAKQVLQAMQKHKFDHVTHVGSGTNAGMTFFWRAN